MPRQYRIFIVILFALLAAGSAWQALHLRFSFDFEQFFPEGDEDLEFFRAFIDQFEADDNFLVVAARRPQGAFDSTFLEKVHRLSVEARSIPFVTESQSLTKFDYPLRTPFGLTTVPVIHLGRPDRYPDDRARILADKRFVHNFITEDATTLVVYLKTVNGLQLEQARTLMAELEALLREIDLPETHILGRAYFQRELVKMQKRELFMSAAVSAVLVTLIMFFIFRKPWGIALALVSIGLGMLLFLGFLGVSGRELNAMAALYPVLMIIVGTSDVIHIMSKYIDELRKGNTRREAIRVTIRQIGLATLLTSVTTAIGFATLFTSRIQPIRDFGINSAVGVLIAYLTVILFTSALLSLFRAEQLIKFGRGQAFWGIFLSRFYLFTRRRPLPISVGGLALLALCVFGISRITTNYDIINNLPRGKQITADFRFFEKHLAGFRPLEIAVYAQDGYRADDYEVLMEMAKVEAYLERFPFVRAVGSLTGVYKSINMMNTRNDPEAYVMPPSEARFAQYRRLAERVPKLNVDVLLSRDRNVARITSRIHDVGADSIKQFGERFDAWVAENTRPEVAQFVRTGTGLIIDKNAAYVRSSLLTGLGLAVLIVSLLMALLFRNARMIFISLVPNLFPLLLAGALLGFLGIELEAGISIVFAVIFGIAVDDTIHFLSKFKLARQSGLNVEQSLYLTFMETGKAITLTTVILFFGFLVMLFSIHPPSVAIGLIISVTLFSALFSDLLFIPVLIRWLMPDDSVGRYVGDELPD